MKPWYLISAKRAHDWAPFFINAWAQLVPARDCTWQSFRWRKIYFPNRLGIAGGVDKDGENVSAWSHLGAGFVEVGTVTPLPQPPNDGKIIDRDTYREALWNKMGFPSKGADEVRKNLAQHAKSVPLFINIGKNRYTENRDASKDYVSLIQKFDGLADAFVINISSPNTQGLRDLQQKSYLGQLIKNVREARRNIQAPVLLKVSPDLSFDELKEIIETSTAANIDGWILTNTTRAREDGLSFPGEGGVSGRPLAAQSKKILLETKKLLGEHKEDRLLISVGGVLSAEDVHERLELGADLVQVYSSLIFSGPSFFRQVARVLRKRK